MHPRVESAKLKVIEVGDYSLAIVDLLGNATTVKEWSIGRNDDKIFDYSIPILKYANGSYMLILNTPTNKYSARFVKQ